MLPCILWLRDLFRNNYSYELLLRICNIILLEFMGYFELSRFKIFIVYCIPGYNTNLDGYDVRGLRVYCKHMVVDLIKIKFRFNILKLDRWRIDFAVKKKNKKSRNRSFTIISTLSFLLAFFSPFLFRMEEFSRLQLCLITRGIS